MNDEAGSEITQQAKMLFRTNVYAKIWNESSYLTYSDGKKYSNIIDNIINKLNNILGNYY